MVSLGSQTITHSFSLIPVSLAHFLTFVSWDHFPNILHCTQALSQGPLPWKFKLRYTAVPNFKTTGENNLNKTPGWEQHYWLPHFQGPPKLSSGHSRSTCSSHNELRFVPLTCCHFSVSRTFVLFSAWITLSITFLISVVQITPSFKTQTKYCGTSLAVQWLGLHASTAGGPGSIPGLGTKILPAPQRGQKTKIP